MSSVSHIFFLLIALSTSVQNEDSVGIAAIQSSWAGMKAALGDKAPETVGRLIFYNLFTDYPEKVKFFYMFGSSKEELLNSEKFMWHARDRVFAALDKLITNLSDKSEVNSISDHLAVKHSGKGITLKDFLDLGNSICKAMAQALGDKLTPELTKNWTTLLTSFMSGLGNNVAKLQA